MSVSRRLEHLHGEGKNDVVNLIISIVGSQTVSKQEIIKRLQSTSKSFSHKEMALILRRITRKDGPFVEVNGSLTKRQKIRQERYNHSSLSEQRLPEKNVTQSRNRLSRYPKKFKLPPIQELVRHPIRYQDQTFDRRPFRPIDHHVMVSKRSRKDYTPTAQGVAQSSKYQDSHPPAARRCLRYDSEVRSRNVFHQQDDPKRNKWVSASLRDK